MALKASQHIECARHHLDDITLTGIASEHSLPTQPLRSSSHGPYRSFRSAELNSTCSRSYLRHFAPTTKRNWHAKDKDRHRSGGTHLCNGRNRCRWRRLRGRRSDEDGDPRASPASGTITSLLVKLDDVVTEGQA